MKSAVMHILGYGENAVYCIYTDFLIIGIMSLLKGTGKIALMVVIF